MSSDLQAHIVTGRGTIHLRLFADQLCQDAFKPYVGKSYLTSDYGYGFYAPTRAEWDGGRHQVVCVVTSDETVGSAKGTRR